MRRFIIPYIILFSLSSCSNAIVEECEVIQEWKVQNYKIEEKQCPDLVLKHYFRYELSIDNKINGTSASNVDSCVFTSQADNETFLILNVCNKSIKELKSYKIPLDAKSIDSVTMFSKESSQTQLLTREQIEKLVKDWNNSKTRGYSDEPFDSAFSAFPSYQYRLTVFSKGSNRPFYGYNYLMLDSSNWKYEMSKKGELSYFDNYWKE
jgi:hypothetical protein